MVAGSKKDEIDAANFNKFSDNMTIFFAKFVCYYNT